MSELQSLGTFMGNAFQRIDANLEALTAILNKAIVGDVVVLDSVRLESRESETEGKRDFVATLPLRLNEEFTTTGLQPKMLVYCWVRYDDARNQHMMGPVGQVVNSEAATTTITITEDSDVSSIVYFYWHSNKMYIHVGVPYIYRS